MLTHTLIIGYDIEGKMVTKPDLHLDHPIGIVKISADLHPLGYLTNVKLIKIICAANGLCEDAINSYFNPEGLQVDDAAVIRSLA